MQRAWIEQRISGLKEGIRQAESQIIANSAGIGELEAILKMMDEQSAPADDSAPNG